MNHFVEFYFYPKSKYITKGLLALQKIRSILGFQENFRYYNASYQLDQIPNKDNRVFLSKKKG